MSAGRLANRICVVTGAAFGIGRATAELFAREGAKLVLTDIQTGPLETLAAELR
ncbi:MAG: SDR family NAD(P)-dependent oxidoreductase, partial [Thermomicrobiales bacterium]